MADYNIYIHSYGQYDAPTTPFQLRAESDTSGVGGEGGGSGGSGFGMIRRAASFILNPDSAIGQTMSTTAGAIGKAFPAALAIGTAIIVAKKVVDFYSSYVSSATGDYGFQIKYNNFFQRLHNAFHPFSNAIEGTKMELELRKQNERNEQERLLFGGSIYSSKYGRTL